MFINQFHGRLVNNNCAMVGHACILWLTGEKQMLIVGCLILVIVLTHHLKLDGMLDGKINYHIPLNSI